MLKRALIRSEALTEAIATGQAVTATDQTSRRDTWLVRANGAAYRLAGDNVEQIEGCGLTLRAAATRLHPLSPGIAGSLGRTVAASHAQTFMDQELPPVSEQLPWAFRLGKPGARYLHQASAASRRLVVELQRLPAMLAQLETLQAAWSPACTTHNDLTWNNLIVYPVATHANVTRVEIIDWEMAAPGDPCWDIGTLLSEFVAFWALSIPVFDGEPYEALAKYPIEDLQPAILAFWESYAKAMAFDRATARERLVKSARFAGARLIQTAYERTQTMTHLTPHIYLLLQLSLNIMERPEDAAEGLFGISLPGRAEA